MSDVPSLLEESNGHNNSPDSTNHTANNILGVQSPIPVPTHSMVTRSKSSIVKPNPKYALVSQAIVIKEPTSIKQALQDKGWFEAMRTEITALEKNHTWTLVPKTHNMNIIGVKWVIKVRYKANNSLDKLKARLVAKGYNQVEGID